MLKFGSYIVVGVVCLAVGYLLGSNSGPKQSKNPLENDIDQSVVFRNMQGNRPENGTYAIYSYSIDGEIKQVREKPTDLSKQWVVVLCNGRIIVNMTKVD